MKNPFSITDHRSRVRIIPQIDKMPPMISFAGTLYGKCTMLLVNLLILWTFFLDISWSLAALCGFLVLVPLAYNWKFILAFVWVAIFGLKDAEFGIWNFGELNRADINNRIASLYTLAGDQLFTYRLFIIVGGACLFFALAYLIKRFQLRWPLLWFVLLWAVLLFIADAVPENTTGALYAWGLFCVVGRCFFGAIYLQTATRSLKKMSTITKFIFPLQGALFGTGNNFLRSPSLFVGDGTKDPVEDQRDRAVCLLKSVKLLLWTRILVFVGDIIQHGAYGSANAWLPSWATFEVLGWSNPVVLGYQKYNELGAPLIQSWGGVFLHSLNFIFLLCAFSGITISFVRMSGVYLPRDTFRPYAAKSFNEFLRRLIFYYSEILVNIFIFPIYGHLRFLRQNKELRLALTLIIAVGLCGWVAHILFMPAYFVWAGGAVNGFHFYLQWIPYFILLGLACAVSALGTVRKIVDSLIPSLFRMPLIFAFYSLLLTTAHGYPFEGSIIDNWHARFIFICSLFGIG